ncbi:hypothetical protein R3P38DRAFT_2800796 [Favolaschia claudopus]|uniref:Uncharacterized protein n=1 Tax=Favolaschia claudopus TaxID=2862362 RepID=A0AAV9ZWK2_9AGAR
MASKNTTTTRASHTQSSTSGRTSTRSTAAPPPARAAPTTRVATNKHQDADKENQTTHEQHQPVINKQRAASELFDYQSTDHSTDITSASDGNDSLEDDDTPKLSTLKSWPPDYRDPMFIELLNDIHTRATEFRKKQEPKKKAKGNKQYVYVRAKEKTRVANTIPAPEDGTKMISTFIASDWLDPFHQDKIDRMGQFVYGSDDEA